MYVMDEIINAPNSEIIFTYRMVKEFDINSGKYEEIPKFEIIKNGRIISIPGEENKDDILQMVNTFEQVDFALLNLQSNKKEAYARIMTYNGKKIFEILNHELFSRQFQCEWGAALFAELQALFSAHSAIECRESFSKVSPS